MSINDLQLRANVSCLSLCDDEIEEQPKNKKEFQATGSVKWVTYKKYFKAARNPFLVILVFVSFIGAELSVSGLNYFLSEW